MLSEIILSINKKDPRTNARIYLHCSKYQQMCPRDKKTKMEDENINILILFAFDKCDYELKNPFLESEQRKKPRNTHTHTHTNKSINS